MEVNVSCRQALKSNMNVEPLNSTEWDDFTQRGRNGRKNVHTYVPQWSNSAPKFFETQLASFNSTCITSPAGFLPVQRRNKGTCTI
jgi:hypothetical protein